MQDLAMIMQTLQAKTKSTLGACFVRLIVSVNDNFCVFVYNSNNIFCEIHNTDILAFCENTHKRPACSYDENIIAILNDLAMPENTEVSHIVQVPFEERYSPLSGILIGFSSKTSNKQIDRFDYNFIDAETSLQIQIAALRFIARYQCSIIETLNNKVSQLDTKIQQAQQNSELYTMLSHEFKTPINVILTATELLSLKLQANNEKQYTEQYKSQCEIITANAYRSLRLTCNLLDTAALEEHKLKLMLSYGDVVQTVKSAVKSMLEIASKRGIKLEYCDKGIDKLNMMHDVEKLERIILNLLSNAIKSVCAAKTENAAVGVSVCENAEYVLIDVYDNGTGIELQEQEKIFDKFYRVNNRTSGEMAGTGLGLAISQKLALLMDGNITVKSESKSGCCFTVELSKKIAYSPMSEELHSTATPYQVDAASSWAKMETSFLCLNTQNT